MSEGARGWTVAALARRGVRQPIERPVPADDARFLARKGPLRIARRVIQHRLGVALAGQGGCERATIDPAWRRAVWFHEEAPYLGDALLDLAPRSLLAEHGIGVDLRLPSALAGVFRGDRWCRSVGRLDEPVDLAGVDFAIVDSRSRRALAHKRAAAPRLPWVSVRGDYVAYDFQRGLLATRRFAELLGLDLDAAAERRHARQKLDDPSRPASDAAAHGRIAITMGGVQPWRTYRHWPAVARALVADGHRRLVLLGSDNGTALAGALREALAGRDADVLDLVGRTDIAGTRAAIAASAALLCVDGGLMHLGCTTATPMLALFDATSLPVWRVPIDFDGTALVSPSGDVNDLGPEAVAAAALAFLQTRVSGPAPTGA